ncbi:CEP76 protein, partial [Certhia familiaris]|nr:CEP76 protein [Certhia familiaris]
QMDVHGRIREVLAETIREELAPEHQQLSTEDLIKALRQRGIIDDVMKELKFVTDVNEMERTSAPKPSTHFVDREPPVLKKTNIDPTRRYLYLQVLGGKAFLEHLQEPEPLPGQTCSTFTLCLHFRNQRFRSKPVPCACEPDFQDGFLLEIHKDSLGDGSKMVDATTMLSICDPVHMVLIRTDTFGETTLVASYFLEWRSVLAAENGISNVAVELLGVGTESKVSVGVLNIRLEMYPQLNKTLSSEITNTQFTLERQKTAEKERLFLVYAKQWWREYLQIRPTHNTRLVKIFAQDENGVNRPVCSYVRPLRAGRLLDTPRQAARFVSVLGYERAALIGGGSGKQEQWCTLLAFLCRNKGDCEDHANLLCSLLLGFGLEAFVCVGTKAKGVPHTWVMTCGSDGTITFWESLTGNRYIHKPINPDDPPIVEQPKPLYPYRTIGCIFNHQKFFGNCQPSDAVEVCVFDLHDESKWKPMSGEAIKSVCPPGATSAVPFPPLCASTIDAAVTSNEIEVQLRILVSEHRKDLGLSTVWDDQLS